VVNYAFYIPGCSQITETSQVDWSFLSELAAEENTPPEVFAAQIISSELARYRDEIAYAEEVKQELRELASRRD